MGPLKTKTFSIMSKAVLSYSEFTAAKKVNEKIDPNLSDLKIGKGKNSSKEVDPEMAELPGGGKASKKEVDPELSELPKGGKKSTGTVTSNLSNLKKGSKGKAATGEIDPKFAKTPSAVK